ncbi:MAG: ribosomal protein S18-alanine N-acetyltransferase [Chloracidobacterium sp.]|nr:ribosomal protein S18-alanine N-acetyltransferase [Chloracidobacterium sp.]
MSESGCGNFRVRRVDSSHIADLIRIAEETNLSPWTAQSYLDEIKNPDAVLLHLEADDNRTVGFVVGRIILGGMIEAQTDAEIYNIAVIRPLQGRGLGQLLLDSFLDASRQRSATNVWLEVRESNAAAIRFYQRNGFERMQTRNNFYSEPRENALLMRLSLETADIQLARS